MNGKSFFFFLFFFSKFVILHQTKFWIKQDETKAKLEYSYQSQIEVAASSFQHLRSLKICQEN